MNISDIEASLPWGLHDAYFEAVEIDWPNARLTLTVRVMMSENQDMDQRAKIVLSGLVFCTYDPPALDATHGYEPTPAGGLWVDTGDGAANADAKRRLPAVPKGSFLNWFFVHQWNSFIHVCARDAELVWRQPPCRRVQKRAPCFPVRRSLSPRRRSSCPTLRNTRSAGCPPQRVGARAGDTIGKASGSPTVAPRPCGQ